MKQAQHLQPGDELHLELAPISFEAAGLFPPREFTRTVVSALPWMDGRTAVLDTIGTTTLHAPTFEFDLVLR